MSCPDRSPLVPLLHCSAPSPSCPAHGSQPAPGAHPCLQLQLREVVIPSSFCLLSAGEHLLSLWRKCGSAADMGIIHTPIPAYKPSTPPSHPLSPLFYPSQGAACFAGHASPLGCQRRGPTSPPTPACHLPRCRRVLQARQRVRSPCSWSTSRWLPAPAQHKINRLRSLPEMDLYREQKV